METQCNGMLFDFQGQNRREVVATFDGGTITTDGGALLLQEVERLTGIIGDFSACFTDHRNPKLIEHTLEQLIAQRIYALALGYEDLNDHDELRHDPVLAVLAGKLAARRTDCAPLAGKSTLNRLELSRPVATRYHKVSHDPAAIERLFVDVFHRAVYWWALRWIEYPGLLLTSFPGVGVVTKLGRVTFT